MVFPDAVTVVIRERDTGLPVKNVAVSMVLFAARKNNYSVGPCITNGGGEVTFTRRDCEFAIKRSQEMFLMDYWGDLHSCRPQVEIRLHRSDSLAKMQRRYAEIPEVWGRAFRDPERLFAALPTVKNAEYEPTTVTVTEDELRTNPFLELTLARLAA